MQIIQTHTHTLVKIKQKEIQHFSQHLHINIHDDHHHHHLDYLFITNFSWIFQTITMAMMVSLFSFTENKTGNGNYFWRYEREEKFFFPIHIFIQSFWWPKIRIKSISVCSRILIKIFISSNIYEYIWTINNTHTIEIRTNKQTILRFLQFEFHCKKKNHDNNIKVDC